MRKIIIYSGLLCLASCNNHQNKNKVELAMKQYDRLIKKMDVDSIALIYTPDGDMGTIAHGRDSIRNFLSNFKNFKVLSQSSSTNSIEINRDTAVQKGSYRQIVVTPQGDTVTVTGEYVATWQRMQYEGWLIKKMITRPAN